jgi:hypothetical protein
MTDQNNRTSNAPDEAVDQDNIVEENGSTPADSSETTIDNLTNVPAAVAVPVNNPSDTTSSAEAPTTPDPAAEASVPAEDDDYVDNFIEDPQGMVRPHAAVNPNNTTNPAMPSTPATPPGTANTATPSQPAAPAETRTNMTANMTAGVTNNVPGNNTSNTSDEGEANMESRLERLGGEPAPVITPEEFARLQKAGQVHIDERGRVRTARRSDSAADAGVSLRKRRAWYG